MTVAVLRYSVLRLAIFVASLFLLSLVGVKQSVLMLVLAAFISLALSYLLLRGPRDKLALELANRVQNRLDGKNPTGVDADAADEDAAIDAATEAAERESAMRPAAVDVPQERSQLSEPLDPPRAGT